MSFRVRSSDFPSVKISFLSSSISCYNAASHIRILSVVLSSLIDLPLTSLCTLQLPRLLGFQNSPYSSESKIHHIYSFPSRRTLGLPNHSLPSMNLHSLHSAFQSPIRLVHVRLWGRQSMNLRLVAWCFPRQLE